MLNTICEVFPEKNLQINANKIDHTIVKREEESRTIERGEKAGIITW